MELGKPPGGFSWRDVGSVAKIIFPQFDTTIITFLYHFPGNVDDKLFQL
jgi:hypothetical protein